MSRNPFTHAFFCLPPDDHPVRRWISLPVLPGWKRSPAIGLRKHHPSEAETDAAIQEARGYGFAHRARRRALAPVVASGKAVCARCLEPIVPGDEWHLDHSDTQQGYVGVLHALCDLRAAAAKTNGRRPVIDEDERQYRWSQKWFDDTPIGTTCGDEIYVGSGVWVKRLPDD